MVRLKSIKVDSQGDVMNSRACLKRVRQISDSESDTEITNNKRYKVSYLPDESDMDSDSSDDEIISISSVSTIEFSESEIEISVDSEIESDIEREAQPENSSDDELPDINDLFGYCEVIIHEGSSELFQFNRFNVQNKDGQRLIQDEQVFSKQQKIIINIFNFVKFF